ncbi:hypothetical protein AK812_SmicGene47849, partial [Symbiodinium microadriaticum]
KRATLSTQALRVRMLRRRSPTTIGKRSSRASP